MIKDEQHHKQYFASMFGKFAWEKHEDFKEDGTPTEVAIQEVKQIYWDLDAAFPGFVFLADWKKQLCEYKGTFEHVLSYKVSTPTPKFFAHPDSTTVNHPDGFQEDINPFPCFICPDCSAPFLTKKEMVGHKVWKHQYRAMERVRVGEGFTCDLIH